MILPAADLTTEPSILRLPYGSRFGSTFKFLSNLTSAKGIADIFGRLEPDAASGGDLRLLVRHSLAARLRYLAALLL